MKKYFILTIICFCSIIQSFAQFPNPSYDSSLVKKLGADERGMKPYIMVILKTGPKKITDKALRDSLFKGHFSNMARMTELGKLVLAGPMLTAKDDFRGLFFFNSTDSAEVINLLQGDPTIRNGIFTTELYKWYGSAAMMMIPEIHKNLTKSISDSAVLKINNGPRVTGVGGIFFKSGDPAALREWYRNNLGLAVNEYGSVFEFRNANRPSEINYLEWSPFSKKTKYFDPSQKEFMVNYRVNDLEGLLKKLRENGVAVVDSVSSYDYGKFVHIMDPEGNKIELWQPVDHVLTGIGSETTK